MTYSATVDDVQDFIFGRLTEQLEGSGFTPAELPPAFDLLLEGVIDSLSFVELIVALENRYGLKFDFDELDADDLTRIGPLCSYVEWKVRSR